MYKENMPDFLKNLSFELKITPKFLAYSKYVVMEVLMFRNGTRGLQGALAAGKPTRICNKKCTISFIKI